MKTKHGLEIAVLAMMVLGAGSARADLITLAPAGAALVAPLEPSTSVALQFSLSSLRSGEGRRIDMAFIEWTIAGVSEDSDVSFAAFPVTAAWTAGTVAGTVHAATGEAAVATWEITPADRKAGNAGFVRLDVTGLVTDWATAGESNHGVVVRTTAIGGEALASQFGNARLVIYYGFGN